MSGGAIQELIEAAEEAWPSRPMIQPAKDELALLKADSAALERHATELRVLVGTYNSVIAEAGPEAQAAFAKVGIAAFACSVLNAGPKGSHPGAALLERMRKLEAVLRQVEEWNAGVDGNLPDVLWHAVGEALKP